MNDVCTYTTPDGLDDLGIRVDEDGMLTGVWFIQPGMSGATPHPGSAAACGTARFREPVRGLDGYFAGHARDWVPRYRLEDVTPFRQAVIDEMLKIPFGATVSYGAIAKAIEQRRGGRVSAQAVGGAVGWNPICLIIPCHRVIGADGRLVGYGGGLANKAALLRHERAPLRAGFRLLPGGGF